MNETALLRLTWQADTHKTETQGYKMLTQTVTAGATRSGGLRNVSLPARSAGPCARPPLQTRIDLQHIDLKQFI